MKLRLVIRDEFGGDVDSEQTWPGLRVGDVLVEAAEFLGAVDNKYKTRLKAARDAASRREE